MCRVTLLLLLAFALHAEAKEAQPRRLMKRGGPGKGNLGKTGKMKKPRGMLGKGGWMGTWTTLNKGRKEALFNRVISGAYRGLRDIPGTYNKYLHDMAAQLVMPDRYVGDQHVGDAVYNRSAFGPPPLPEWHIKNGFPPQFTSPPTTEEDQGSDEDEDEEDEDEDEDSDEPGLEFLMQTPPNKSRAVPSWQELGTHAALLISLWVGSGVAFAVLHFTCRTRSASTISLLPPDQV